MFEKKKALNEVSRVRSISRECAASIVLGKPTYMPEIDFEISFFFLFMFDYRVWHKETAKLRKMIIDEFMKNIANDSRGKNYIFSDESIESIYNYRITDYYSFTGREKSIKDFLDSSAELISFGAVHLLTQSDAFRNPYTSINKFENEVVVGLATQLFPGLIEPVSMALGQTASKYMLV